MPKPPAKPTVEPDTHPDAWQRFEKAVDVALKTKPMHKPKPSAAATVKKARAKKRG